MEEEGKKGGECKKGHRGDGEGYKIEKELFIGRDVQKVHHQPKCSHFSNVY